MVLPSVSWFWGFWKLEYTNLERGIFVFERALYTRMSVYLVTVRKLREIYRNQTRARCKFVFMTWGRGTSALGNFEEMALSRKCNIYIYLKLALKCKGNFSKITLRRIYLI